MASEDGTQLTINNIDENVDIVDVDEVALGSTNNKLNDIVVNLDRGEAYTIIALGEGEMYQRIVNIILIILIILTD